MVACVGLVGGLLPWVPFLQEGEARSIDARFQLRGPLPVKNKVVVVAIDDATETAWREIPKAMWGGPLAELVQALNQAGVKKIGLDFVVSVDPDNYLSSKGIDEQPNAKLDEEIIESGERVLLGTGRAGDVVAPLDRPERLASVNRTSIVPGVVRRVPRVDESFVPPLAGLAAALVDEPEAHTRPIEINYSGLPPQTYSARDVLEGRIEPGLLRGAVVLVGETYAGTSDLHPTPFGTSVPGVWIHAEAARTLLDGNELRVWPTWAASLVSFLSALFGAVLASRFWITRFLVIGGGAALIWSGFAYWSFANQNAVIPWFVPVLTGAFFAPSAVYAARAWEEYRERLWVRSRWGQLVGESTLNRLEANRKEGRGAWETFECAVLFLDVANFSSMTRQSGAAETIRVLNAVFAEVIGCVEASGGEVLNFMGDGLAAKWEFATYDRDELHDRVLNAAFQILDRVEALNRGRALGEKALGVRIGLSSGETTLALIGSEGRQQMTLYGEAVNLAARLEAAGKEPDVQSCLVVSEPYLGAANRSGKTFRSGSLTLKGWDAPTQFYFLEG